MSGIFSTVRSGFDNVKSHITGLASEAWSWGSDIIQGIIDGIRSKIYEVADAVTDIANTIRDYLHFSVPDKGPLTDYESWMPDFMQGLSDGINKSKRLVESAISGVSETMQVQWRADYSEAILSGSGNSGVTNNYYNTDNSRTINQTNNSPKALSRLEIYRQTRNAARE